MSRESWINFRLSPAERAALDRLAQESGRNRSEVMRSLLVLAAADPATRRRLGDLPTVAGLESNHYPA